MHVCDAPHKPKEITKKKRDNLSLSSPHHTGAHIVYTSGTTGRPKGVVTTHQALAAQLQDVVTAWEITSADHVLHFLPLHHVHGILNNLHCVHYAGGSVDFLSSASPEQILTRLSGTKNEKKPAVTMLMAVPTVYKNLLEAIEKRLQDAEEVERAIQGAKRLRVAISGSMACPLSILDRWQQLTGQKLLERYGMTELGMVLTNPLHGERHLGYVGTCFPSVSVRLVDMETEKELDPLLEQEGELRVKGPTVFREYWKKPEVTASEFDDDGWFKTGDVAQYNAKLKSFRIRGRASADIIKSAGYKVSALDIERVLLEHPQVKECAVFGIPDEKYGQIVTALIRGGDGKERDGRRETHQEKIQTHEDFVPPLTEYATTHLASYRVPRKYFFVNEIPKNAMGKVNKKALVQLFRGQ